MSTLKTRQEPDGLVITLDDATGLNDFRSSTFRDSLYETVQALDPPGSPSTSSRSTTCRARASRSSSA